MNPHPRSRTWIVVAWVAAALLSGPATVAAVWLVATAGFVVLPDAAPKFGGPQGRERDFTELLATADQTGGSLGMFRQTIAPNSGPPTHVHHTEDEFFYVVNGEFKVKVGDRVMNAPAQSVMFVPRGTAHTFQNIGAAPGVLLVGVTPGGFEKMFQERQGGDKPHVDESAQYGSGGAAAEVNDGVLHEQTPNPALQRSVQQRRCAPLLSAR